MYNNAIGFFLNEKKNVFLDLIEFSISNLILSVWCPYILYEHPAGTLLRKDIKEMSALVATFCTRPCLRTAFSYLLYLTR